MNYRDNVSQPIDVLRAAWATGSCSLSDLLGVSREQREAFLDSECTPAEAQRARAAINSFLYA